MDEVLKILEEVKPGVNFSGVTNLVDGGVLDSFEVITVVSELNDAFDIEIPLEDIDPDNFNSVEGIWKLVGELKND